MHAIDICCALLKKNLTLFRNRYLLAKYLLNIYVKHIEYSMESNIKLKKLGQIVASGSEAKRQPHLRWINAAKNV